jgi:hypothetical protein
VADFCTVQDVENLLQIEITGATRLAACQRAITEATAAIRNYCHQYIEWVAADVITLDCAGGTRLFLPELPVTEVAEVVEDDEILTEDDDYKLGQHGILHRVDCDWEAGIQIVTITYTHGYASPLPDDIVVVATRAAARVYQVGLRASDTEGVPGISAKSLGDYSVSYASEVGGGVGEGLMGVSGARMLLLSEKDILNKYRYVMQ